MKKTMLVIFAIAILIVPAFCAGNTSHSRQNAGKTTMTKEQKVQAKLDKWAQKHQENLAFRKDVYEKNRAKLQARLSKNTKLTQAQKDELLKAYDDKFNAKIEHRESQYKKSMEFIAKTADDPSMTQEKRKAAIKDHFNAQKKENKKFSDEQKTELKTEREKIKAEEEKTAPSAK